MLQGIRTLVHYLVPDRFQDFIGRHFTWLSGTTVIGLASIIILLVILFVPSATTNEFLKVVLKLVGVIFGGLTFLGTLLTIQDWWEKRGLELPPTTDNDSEQDGLSTPARGFVESDEQRMKRAMDELEGWFIIREEGEIILQPEPDQISADRRGILYVFAARVAYDAGERESPKVSKKEVRDEVDFSSASAGVFIDKMFNEDEYFISLDFDPEDAETVYEIDDEEMTFELNIQEVSEVVEYIKGERHAPD